MIKNNKQRHRAKETNYRASNLSVDDRVTDPDMARLGDCLGAQISDVLNIHIDVERKKILERNSPVLQDKFDIVSGT
jgi:hypothetical protein